MSTMTPAQLTTWIADLCGRLERGELSAIGTLQVQPWLTVTDVERYVLDLIREVDYWRSLPVEERRGSAPMGSQQRIASELTALHERLVEGVPCPGPAWSPMGPPRRW